MEINYYNIFVMERIQKYLSSCGVASRRKIEDLIIEGKVKVNGEKAILGQKVDGNELIEVDGKIINKKEDKVYYLLYKPEKIISSTKDERNRKTVIDLIKETRKIYPVGRLDYDTSGLLILTNDGELSNKLMHPRNNVEKEYYVVINGILKKEDIIEIKNGIVLDGIKTKKTTLRIKKYDKKLNRSYIYITLTEGRNHEVKNIFMHFGYKVLKLKRIRYSFLNLEGLKIGEYRTLSIKEVKKLYNEVR